MKNRFNIVIRVANYNEGRNKYATVISEEQVGQFAKAVNSNIESVLINGIRLCTKNLDYVKIFKIKPTYDNQTDDDIKTMLRRDAKNFFKGRITVTILRQHGEEVTGQYIKSGTLSNNADQWVIIHEVIKNVSQEKFEDGYFADSVLSALKEINDIIKREYFKVVGKEEDGTTLMRKAFAHTQPVFKLTDLSSESQRNIQQGYMDIFAGAMMGIRNPKAHANIQIDEQDAWEKIVLASHLMKMWDNRIK